MHRHRISHRLLLLLALGLALALPQAASAHAVVTAHSLQEQPIQVGQPTVVKLFFNSTIEFALSKVQLLSGDDAHQTVPIKSGKKRGELNIHLPGLEAGNYALRYKVFAADGHLTEDVLRFRVTP